MWRAIASFRMPSTGCWRYFNQKIPSGLRWISNFPSWRLVNFGWMATDTSSISTASRWDAPVGHDFSMENFGCEIMEYWLPEILKLVQLWLDGFEAVESCNPADPSDTQAWHSDKPVVHSKKWFRVSRGILVCCMEAFRSFIFCDGPRGPWAWCFHRLGTGSGHTGSGHSRCTGSTLRGAGARACASQSARSDSMIWREDAKVGQVEWLMI